MSVGLRAAVAMFAPQPAYPGVSVPQMARRLAKAGFNVTALLGDYRGGPWDERADVWVILAKKPPRGAVRTAW